MNEIVRSNQTTEITTATLNDHAQSPIDRIIAESRGGLVDERRASYDLESPQGLDRTDVHDAAEMTENEKAAWYNVPFSCVAWSMKTAMTKKDFGGEVLDRPKLLVRTVLETDDGRLLVSSSSWFAADALRLFREHGEVSEKRPLKLCLCKLGPADGLRLAVKRSAKDKK